jgi:hypothetical protein
VVPLVGEHVLTEKPARRTHVSTRLYGTVMVVPSPLALTENVPILLDV